MSQHPEAEENAPRVWIACLACYNSGRMHGRWIDATEASAMEEAKNAIVAECGGEEWAIHDTDGFHSIRIEESEDFARVAEIAEALAAYGEPLAKFWEYDETANVEQFTESFRGIYDSVEEYAEGWLEDSGELEAIPQHLRSYFDVAAYARDLELGGDIWSARLSSGSVAVFGNY